MEGQSILFDYNTEFMKLRTSHHIVIPVVIQELKPGDQILCALEDGTFVLQNV